MFDWLSQLYLQLVANFRILFGGLVDCYAVIMMRRFNFTRTILFLLVTVASVALLSERAEAQTCSEACRAKNSHSGNRLSFGKNGNYCSEFSACSIDHDLSGATGEELERYKAEKALDGETFSDWTAPDFTLPSTEGERVSLSDYRGQSVVLIFMSGHCSHCLDTHKILPELQAEYESKGLAVLPVYINSGSVEDVHDWSKFLDVNYPILVSRSKDLTKLYDSRMVPSFFLINSEGKITRKFVGYKNRSTLDKAFAELVQQS